MLKISDFSRLSRISIRMLRFYDEHDVLKPSMVKENGYRYYDYSQLIPAFHIQYFHYLGFSTDKMKELIHIYQSGKEITQYLNLQLKDLKTEKYEIEEKIEALTKTIEKIKQEEIIMNYKVEVKEMPEKYMMCKRDIIPSYDKEGLLWEGLHSEINSRHMNVQCPENGMSMAVFYDKGYQEKDVDVEIRVEVDGEYEDTDHIKFRTIAPVKVASITFTGSYDKITEISYCIAKWIEEHHYEMDGPNFSIYHVGYGQTNNPEEFVTEICYPIK